MGPSLPPSGREIFFFLPLRLLLFCFFFFAVGKTMDAFEFVRLVKSQEIYVTLIGDNPDMCMSVKK